MQNHDVSITKFVWSVAVIGFALLVISDASIVVAKDKNDALLDAAVNGKWQEVKLLLNQGADVNARNKDGETALMLAVMPLTIEFSARVLGPHGEAVRKPVQTVKITTGPSSYEIVWLLLNKGADVNAKSDAGDTALMWAAGSWRGAKQQISENHVDVEIVKLLLDKGADINAKDTLGITALIIASSKGYVEVVKTLLDKGADINAKDAVDITALYAASLKGHIDVVKVLLDKGADINTKDNDGATPVMAASVGGQIEVLKILLDKGADVKAKDNSGKTALMHAAKNGKKEIVKLLKAHGAK